MTTDEFFTEVNNKLSSESLESAIDRIRNEPNNFSFPELMMLLSADEGKIIESADNNEFWDHSLSLLSAQVHEAENREIVFFVFDKLIRMCFIRKEQFNRIFELIKSRKLKRLGRHITAALSNNLGNVLQNRATSESEIVLAVRCYVFAAQAYLHAKGVYDNAFHEAQDSATSAARIIYQLLGSSVLKEKALSSEISHTLKVMKKLKQRLTWRERTPQSFAYEGVLCLFAPRWLKFFRLSNSVIKWQSAMRLASERGDIQSQVEVSMIVERFELTVAENPVSRELAQYSSNLLDKWHYAGLWIDICRAFDAAKLLCASRNSRREYLEGYLQSYDGGRKVGVEAARQRILNMEKGSLLEFRDHELFPQEEFRKQFQEKSPELVDRLTDIMIDNLKKSNAVDILSEHLFQELKFGLFLRAHDLENNFTLTARPRSYHYRGVTVEGYEPNSFKDGWAKTHPTLLSIKDLISDIPLVSIANVWDMQSLFAQVPFNPICTSNKEWRQVAFSLIEEAAIIFVAIPRDLKFDRYSGLAEELHYITQRKLRDKVVHVRVPNDDPLAAADQISMVMMKATEVIEKGGLVSGTSLAGPFPKEDVEEKFGLTAVSSPENWSVYTINSDDFNVEELVRITNQIVDG